MIMHNIAISGHAGHGKDTVADWFTAEPRRSDFVRVAFADALKRLVSDQTGIPVDAFYTHKEHTIAEVYEAFNLGACPFPSDMKLRKLLLVVGTEIYRTYDVEFWSKKTAKTILDLNWSGVYAVIADMRFLSERAFLDSFPGLIGTFTYLHVLRPDAPVNLNHQSESEVPALGRNCHQLIINNADIPALHMEVARCYKSQNSPRAK